MSDSQKHKLVDCACRKESSGRFLHPRYRNAFREWLRAKSNDSRGHQTSNLGLF